MSEFYMVWVAGRSAPSIVYDTLEAATEHAEFMRHELTGREVYVLAPVAVVAGRPIVQIHPGKGCRSQRVVTPANIAKAAVVKVEAVKPAPPVVVVKKRRVVAMPA